MYEGKPAVFKGSKDGVVLLINREAPFDQILSYLEMILDERKYFFSGAYITLDTNGRELSENELRDIEDLLKKYAISFKMKGKEKVYAREVVHSTPQNVENVMVIPHTLRSGQLVNFDGNVVILGDINEGAEVHAGFDVYVFGIVRGIVDAGRRVVSIGFRPLRMTVNKKVFESLVNDKSYKKPRVAELVNGEITIKPVGEKEKKRRGKS